MSIQAIVWAIDTRVGDPVLKLLLMTLANYANAENQMWHHQAKIAYDTEIPVRTLRRKLQQLVDLGMITVEERRREDGTKTSSMITVQMQHAAMVADGASGQKGVQPAATKVAGQESKKNRKIDSMSYSEEFETRVWAPYPRKANTSKKKAHDIWRLLSAENQARVIGAIPIFAADMRREGRPDDKIKHLQFWLSERIYETVNDPTTQQKYAVANATIESWHKTASREEWVKALFVWRLHYNWNPGWGPAPGKPGCMLPEDLLTDMEKHQISLQRDAKRKGPEAA